MSAEVLAVSRTEKASVLSESLTREEQAARIGDKPGVRKLRPNDMMQKY